MKNIGIKFCGGCNPKYDRGLVLNRIKEVVGNKLSVSIARNDKEYNVLIVISGCLTSCTDYSKILYRNEIIFIKEDISIAELEKILKKYK